MGEGWIARASRAVTAGARPLLARLFPATATVALRSPVDARTVRVATFGGGDILPWWQRAAESTLNYAFVLAMTSAAVALSDDPLFSLLWLLLHLVASHFGPLRLRLFPRRPRNLAVAYVAAATLKKRSVCSQPPPG